MKTLVIYRSKSGYTKTYAGWIAEALKCDIKVNKKLRFCDVEPYDTVICGGGMYACSVDGISFIKDNWEKLSGKNIIVWATGSNPGREAELSEMWAKNLTEEQLKKSKHFIFAAVLTTIS